MMMMLARSLEPTKTAPADPAADTDKAETFDFHPSPGLDPGSMNSFNLFMDGRTKSGQGD
jgi:hypothetical protein